MKLVIFLVCCVAIVHSWTAIEQVPIDPNNPEVCVSKNTKLGTMKKGETIDVPEGCARATCSPGYITYAGCGSILPPKDCKLSLVDFSKPYPKCCPQVVCP